MTSAEHVRQRDVKVFPHINNLRKLTLQIIGWCFFTVGISIIRNILTEIFRKIFNYCIFTLSKYSLKLFEYIFCLPPGMEIP